MTVQRTRPRLAVSLAILLSGATLLAGCNGNGGTSTTPTSDCNLEPVLCDPDHYLANHHCITQDIRPRIYAPDTPGPDGSPDPWVQGDWWTYRLDVGTGSKRSTLVYYEDADFDDGVAQHYLVGVPDRADALEHALFSVNPMIGRIHRTLYSPHESGLHADMFNFPLCEGATWSTEFYDRRFTLTVQQENLTIPGGVDPHGFVIKGTASDGSTLRHTYSPIVKWFTEIRVDRNDGLKVRLDLDSYGQGKSGRVEFLRAQKDEVVALDQVPADGWPIDREAGSEGAYDKLGLSLEMTRTAGTGKVEVHLRDPAGASVACVGVSGANALEKTTCPAGPLRLEVPWQEGVWEVTVERLVIDTQTKVEGEVRVVSLYDRGGTV